MLTERVAATHRRFRALWRRPGTRCSVPGSARTPPAARSAADALRDIGLSLRAWLPHRLPHRTVPLLNSLFSLSRRGKPDASHHLRHATRICVGGRARLSSNGSVRRPK